jgi:hypothetical protein
MTVRFIDTNLLLYATSTFEPSMGTLMVTTNILAYVLRQLARS